MYTQSNTRLLSPDDESKIKYIIRKDNETNLSDEIADQFELVPYILNFLHNEISNIYHYTERISHSIDTGDGSLEKQAGKEIEAVSTPLNNTENPHRHANNEGTNAVGLNRGVAKIPEGVTKNFISNSGKQRDNNKQRIKPEQITSKNSYYRNKGQFSKSKNDANVYKAQLPPDLHDENAFPSLGSVVVPEVKKRMKPNTMSKCAPASGFLYNGLSVDSSPTRFNNVAFTSAPIKEKNNLENNFREERQLLKAFQEESKTTVKFPVQTSPVKSSSNTESSVIPDFNKVTEIEKLDVLIKFYVRCINSNFVPNLATEFYFLCQLLTMKFPSVVNSETEISVFFSVHNCAYFAINVLESCPEMLSLLQPTSLRLILEMSHIPPFSSHFIDVVQGLLVEKTRLQLINPFNCKETVEDAAYREEIDSRENFSSEKSFAAYRKQRDSFKKVLKDWEDHSHEPEWLYGSSFKNEVRHMCADNAFHMAKLFLSELEARCMLDEIGEDVEDELLSKFEGAKLRKLQKRMKSSLSAYEDPNSNVVFQYFEEFFRDFLQRNNSLPLYQHLLDMLYTKVIELNDCSFNATPSDLPDNSKIEKVFQRIKELRLYAKFLGFLYFLPYQTEEMPPTNIAHELKKIRNRHSHVATIREILSNALKNKGLSLVIPWIVEYLSNMDKIAPTLSEYEELFIELICIYRYVLPLIKNSHTRLFLKINLGRLFGNFSQRMFFVEYPASRLASEWNRVEKMGLDNSYMINEKLTRLCCPNVAASENLLRNYFYGKVKEPRKIKPYAVEDKIPNFCFSTEVSHLQRKLEANFFHLNPALKEVVEFSTERATAKVKESFQIIFLPKIKESILEKVNYKNISAGKASAQKEITTAVGLIHKEIWSKAPEYVKNLCDKLCLEIVKISSSISISAVIAETASKIASRAATNKVLQFIQTYTSNESLRAELKDSIKAYSKQLNFLESTNNYVKIEPVVTSVMDYSVIKIIENLRSFSSALLVKETPLESSEDILRAIDKCKVGEDYLTKSLKLMVADWYVTLIVYAPQIINSNFYLRFYKFYDQFEIKPSNLISLVCVRNLELLKKSPQKILSWRQMEFNVIYLLEKGWLTRKELEGQCLTILKCNWPENLLRYFAGFLSAVVEKEKCSRKLRDDEFLEIMDWLTWFCQEP